MEETQIRGGVIYSSSGIPFQDISKITGLFKGPNGDNYSPEDPVLDAVVRGSNLSPQSILGILVGTYQNGVEKLKTLFLSRRGYQEMIQPELASPEHSSQNSLPILRLEDNLDDPFIIELIKERDLTKPNDRPLPSYRTIDKDRVLALYIKRDTKENKKK